MRKIQPEGAAPAASADEPNPPVESGPRREKTAGYVGPKILWEQEFVALAGCSTVQDICNPSNPECCDPIQCDGC